MNIPGITRALELDDADWDLAVKLRGLTEHQREQFSAALGPAKSSKKSTTKKPAGKGGGGKSKHASSLQQQVGTVLKPLADIVNQPRCIAMIDDNSGQMECGESIDHNAHHKQTDPDYHEFIAPPATHAATGSTGD